MGILTAACLSAPIGARAAPVEPLPPAGGAVSRSVGSVIYVMGPDHLARIMSEDDLLRPRALSLVSRVKIGAGVMMGSVLLGALMTVGAATFFTQTECTTSALGGQFCASGRLNGKLAVAGLLTAAVGGGVGVAIAPRRSDWYEIINDWNARHPDRTLLVAPGRYNP